MARGSVTVKVEGLEQLGQNLKTFTEEIKAKVLRAAARKAANEVRDTAKKIAMTKLKPGKDPPHLVDAIAVRRLSKASKNGREFFAVGVFKISKSAKTGKAYTYANTRANRRTGKVGKGYEVDPPEFYWKFHELGTVKMKKRPFLVPAFDQRKQGSPQVMAKELNAGMQRATRKLTKGKKAKA